MNLKRRHLICEISDQTSDIKDYHVRKAARGILLHKGKIALLYVSKNNYHKLPGGGINNGETNEEAFKREVLEEVGCKCIIKDEGPITLEYRDQYKMVQISYIFLAEVDGKIGQSSLEQGEIDEGFQLVWVPIEKVESILSKDKPLDYQGMFVHFRDPKIFEFYEKILYGKTED